jgi:hypothetical protein
MRLKKSFSFTDKNQIWRLLISDTDNLIIETRNTDKKEVFFHCINLEKGKTVFKNFQLDEKFWIGIEAIQDTRIFFHKFAKPNMPEHKKIICYDINKNKILWQNDELTFLSLAQSKIYAFKKKFEGQDVFVLDSKTGKVLEELGSDFKRINEIMNNINVEEDYSNYKYAEKYTGEEEHTIISLIEKEVSDKDISSLVEFLVYEEFLVFNFYVRSATNLLDNMFIVYNIVKKKKVLSDIINKNLNSFSPDSFFCYKNFLILLKNKSEVSVYKIE